MPFKNKPAGLPWPCLQCEHRQAPHIPPHPVADPELGEVQLENLRAADQERGQPWCTWTAAILCIQREGSWPWGVAAWQSWHITDFWLQIPTLFGSMGKKKPFFSRAIIQVAGGDGLDPIPRKPKPLTLRASITQDRFPQTSPNSCFPVWFGRKKGWVRKLLASCNFHCRVGTRPCERLCEMLRVQSQHHLAVGCVTAPRGQLWMGSPSPGLAKALLIPAAPLHIGMPFGCFLFNL